MVSPMMMVARRRKRAGSVFFVMISAIMFVAGSLVMSTTLFA